MLDAIAALRAERDAAVQRAEAAGFIKGRDAAKDAIIAALDMKGSQMAGRYDQNKLDFFAVAALTPPADLTAALDEVIFRYVLDGQLRAFERGRIDTPDELRALRRDAGEA